MPTNHQEIEIKIQADVVHVDDFLAWAMELGPVSYESGSSPDLYYSQNGNTVRHRWSGESGGELTVKRRVSKTSTLDRKEVDLEFANGCSFLDVTEFLKDSGWKKLFTLFKEWKVFWYDLPQGGQMSLSYYEVEKLNVKTQKREIRKTFIEFEVEKGSAHTTLASKQILNDWYDKFSKRFGDLPIVQNSLYEIYSGKKYKTVRR